MVDVIIQRKKNWIGHVVRGNGLLREITEEKWMVISREEDHLLAYWKTEKCFLSANERKSGNRSEWRCYVHRTSR